jgi:hypothetical protein
MSVTEKRMDGPSATHARLDLDAEYDMLEEALKRLSSGGGKGDKTRARELLQRLSRSRNEELREDVQALVRAAKTGDWFGDRTPDYSQLLDIARRSIRYHESQLARCRLSRLILLSLFLVLLIAAVAADWTGAAPVNLTFPALVGAGAVLFMVGLLRWACARWTS